MKGGPILDRLDYEMFNLAWLDSVRLDVLKVNNLLLIPNDCGFRLLVLIQIFASAGTTPILDLMSMVVVVFFASADEMLRFTAIRASVSRVDVLPGSILPWGKNPIHVITPS